MRKLLSRLSKTLMVIFLSFGLWTPVYGEICKAVAIGTTTNYQIFGQLGAAEHQITATSFSLTNNCVVSAIGVYIAKESTRTQQDAYSTLYNDSSGLPGSVLGTGSSINSISNYSTFTWSTSTYNTTVSLNAGTTYWVAMNASTTQTQILTWNRGDIGTSKAWNGASWIDANAPAMTAVYNLEGSQSPASAASLNAADIIFFDF